MVVLTLHPIGNVDFTNYGDVMDIYKKHFINFGLSKNGGFTVEQFTLMAGMRMMMMMMMMMHG